MAGGVERGGYVPAGLLLAGCIYSCHLEGVHSHWQGLGVHRATFLHELANVP